MAPPDLSVVIPTMNGGDVIVATLEALAEQTLSPERFEVVVVDDGSDDGTADVLEGRSWPFPLTVIRQANAGQGSALNRGAAAAGARVLLFLDDDIAAEPAMLAAHLAAHDDCANRVVLGHLDFDADQEPDLIVRELAAWWPEHYRRLAAAPESATYMQAFSGNLSVPASLFRSCGGFATDLARSFDIELGWRLRAAGGTFFYAADARGMQLFDKDGAAVLRDAENEGFAAAQLLERHPAMLPDLRAGQLATAGALTRLLVLAFTRLPRTLRSERAVARAPRRLRARAFSIVYDASYWRGLRRALGRGRAWDALVHPPLVLMYHAFSPAGTRGSRWILPAHRFAAHLAAIKLARFRVVSLSDLADAVATGRHMGRSIVLTIDDGYADVAELAAPHLRRRRLPATVFLVTEAMGAGNCWDEGPPLAGRPIMTWSQVEDLQRHGITFGGHSRSHARLDLLDDDVLRSEVDGSMEDLEERLGTDERWFAYPYGKSGDAPRAAVRASGYRGGLGIQPGPVTSSSTVEQLPRNEVYGTVGPIRLAVGLLLGSLEWDARARARVSSLGRRLLRRR